jgi:hypothetical protein
MPSARPRGIRNLDDYRSRDTVCVKWPGRKTSVSSPLAKFSSFIVFSVCIMLAATWST